MCDACRCVETEQSFRIKLLQHIVLAQLEVCFSMHLASFRANPYLGWGDHRGHKRRAWTALPHSHLRKNREPQHKLKVL